MKTETKHTPGPWYKDGAFINFQYTDADGNKHHGTICDVALRGETMQANARLIAAAPRMLEALEAFLRAPSIGSSGPGSVTIEVQTFNLNTARAAIAAARGES